MPGKTATEISQSMAPSMLEAAMRNQKHIDRLPGLRGANEVMTFAGEMVSILNKPRNVAKGGWIGMSWEQITDKLCEEFIELLQQTLILEGNTDADLGDIVVRLCDVAERVNPQILDGAIGVLREAPDLGNVAMMAFDKAKGEVYGKGR